MSKPRGHGGAPTPTLLSDLRTRLTAVLGSLRYLRRRGLDERATANQISASITFSNRFANYHFYLINFMVLV